MEFYDDIVGMMVLVNMDVLRLMAGWLVHYAFCDNQCGHTTGKPGL